MWWLLVSLSIAQDVGTEPAPVDSPEESDPVEESDESGDANGEQATPEDGDGADVVEEEASQARALTASDILRSQAVPSLIDGQPEPLPPGAGSLWQDRNTRLLVGMDGIARSIGDLVTVQIDEETRTQVTADTNTNRGSEVSGGIGSLFGLAQGVVNSNSNMGGGINLEVSGEANYVGGGDTSREGSLEGVMTCTVVDVMANGNLLIEGAKQVRVNRETMFLALSGIVRPQDIQVDNTVQSSLMASLQVEFTGSGVVSDRQGPGVGTRVIDHVWPF